MRLGCLLTLLAISAAGFCQNPGKFPTLTARSSVSIVPNEEHYLTPRTDNVRYTTSGHGPWEIYEERFVTQDNGGNCCYTHITVNSFHLDKSGVLTKLWTISAPGESGSLYDDFYKIFLGGCCGDSNTFTYYLADTGKQLYRSIQPLQKIDVAYSRDMDRYVAILNERTPDQHPMAPGTGLLDYGSATRVQERLFIRFGDHELMHARLRGGHPRQRAVETDDEESESGVSVNWERAPESRTLLSGIGIELEFFENVKVTLPIENDRIQLDKATLPAGLKIERLPIQ